jgi:3-isopropylmalate/(R)-2-methylmalate dehydratase small subunit
MAAPATRRGKAFIYGDNVDTDAIIPARYLDTTDPEELASHCMEDIDADFVRNVEPGDIIVAGENFGCGSSREHAPIAIKAAGVSCVIAASFARIFYRNAVNIGLPILESRETVRDASAGDIVEVDLSKGLIVNETKGLQHRAEPFPPFMQEIIDAGGLVNSVKREIEWRKPCTE